MSFALLPPRCSLDVSLRACSFWRQTMTRIELPTLIRHLRRVVGLRGAGAVPDAQLLERFVTTRDESAFELLVWRHAGMVFSVCRRVVQREQDAEDAFQATFLMLACKAGSISKRSALAAWLHRVAYRMALRARTGAIDRARHERQIGKVRASRIAPDPLSEAAQVELHRVLDEEVNRLPQKYQVPFVLCYLEGKTNEEAAEQLRCPTGTIVTRLARARQRLRSRLARRGLEVSAGTFAVVLTYAAEPMSARAALLDAAVRTGTVTSVNQAAAAGVVTAEVAALTTGVSKAMMMTKLKIVVAFLWALGVAGAGTTALTFRTSAAEAPSILPIGQEEAVVADADQQKTPKQLDREKSIKPGSGKQSQKVEELVTKTFKTGNAPRLVVDLHNGGIDIDASAEGEVNIRVTKEARAHTKEAAQEALKHLDVKMTQDGDKITVTATRDQEQLTESSVGASAAIKVPAGAALELNTHNGGVNVKGGKGAVRVQTSNGAIHITNNLASQHLMTRNGAVIVTGGTGKLEVETSMARLKSRPIRRRLRRRQGTAA